MRGTTRERMRFRGQDTSVGGLRRYLCVVALVTARNSGEGKLLLLNHIFRAMRVERDVRSGKRERARE